MPDWSYHPVLRPLLQTLPPAGRAWALDIAGAFAASTVGGRLVKGTAGPDPRLTGTHMGLTFNGPVGAGITTPHIERLAPLVSRLGVGYVEFGPVDAAADDAKLTQAEAELTRLATTIPAEVRRGCRILVHADRDSNVHRVMARFAPFIEFFTLSTEGADAPYAVTLANAVRDASRLGRPVLAVVQASPKNGDAASEALSAGASGIVWRTHESGRDSRAGDTLGNLRADHPDASIIVETDAETPGAAIDWLDAGANLVTVGSGFADAGPGLPKRINETLAARLEPPSVPASWREGWMGHFLLGIGMVVSGLLAWIVALTRVVLPYDESFIGLTREELAAVNPNLLDFLAHDRITLAGTMISIGILYGLLAWFGERRGARWAGWTVTASATVGFASFFLFLGFGYFDPLHAFDALVLLPFFVWGLRRDPTVRDTTRHEDVDNDAAWRAAQWGQLGFIAIGTGLILAGSTIAIVGSTSVFVPQDLAFLDTTADALASASSRVIPLVAHDRAGFGGALVADGIAVFLTGLWAIRRGARWVWWTLFASGAVGFVAAVGIHARVGYLDAIHLAPVAIAVVLFAASLGALWPYLTRD